MKIVGLIVLFVFLPLVIIAGVFNIGILLALFKLLGVTVAIGWLLNLFRG